MPVDASHGLIPLNSFANGSATHGDLDRVAVVVDWPELVVKLRGHVEPGVEGRAVEVEHERALVNVGVDERRHLPEELGLVELTLGVPRRPIRIPGARQQHRPHFHDSQFRTLDTARAREDAVDRTWVVVPRRNDAAEVADSRSAARSHHWPICSVMASSKRATT